jgi:hypothetical protein
MSKKPDRTHVTAQPVVVPDRSVQSLNQVDLYKDKTGLAGGPVSQDPGGSALYADIVFPWPGISNASTVYRVLIGDANRMQSESPRAPCPALESHIGSSADDKLEA